MWFVITGLNAEKTWRLNLQPYLDHPSVLLHTKAQDKPRNQLEGIEEAEEVKLTVERCLSGRTGTLYS